MRTKTIVLSSFQLKCLGEIEKELERIYALRDRLIDLNRVLVKGYTNVGNPHVIGLDRKKGILMYEPLGTRPRRYPIRRTVRRKNR